MTLEDNKDVARRFIMAISHGDVEELRRIMVPNPFLSGTVEQMAQGVKAAFPDSTVDITEVIAEGNSVAISLSQTGLNSGPLMGKPPTGKEMTVSAIFILKMKEGRVVSMISHSDLGMQLQLASQS